LGMGIILDDEKKAGQIVLFFMTTNRAKSNERCHYYYKERVKLPAHMAGLPGREMSFLIVPFDPAYKAGLTGHLPVKRGPDPFGIEESGDSSMVSSAKKGYFEYLVCYGACHRAGIQDGERRLR